MSRGDGEIVTAQRTVDHANGRTMICVAKATYALGPGVLSLATEADPIVPEDIDAGAPRRGQIFQPSDFAPVGSPEYTVVGSAFSQGLVHRVPVKVRIGGREKELTMSANRKWTSAGGVHLGAPFDRMSLGWDRAAASPENPDGIPPDANEIPNVQPADLSDEDMLPGQPFPAVGLGPLRPTNVGRGVQYAPSDQRLDILRGDEEIELENLHPQLPTLRAKLPGHSPRARVAIGGSTYDEPMQAVRLQIDTDRAVVTLTWRAEIELGGAELDPGGRVRPACVPSDVDDAFSGSANDPPALAAPPENRGGDTMPPPPGLYTATPPPSLLWPPRWPDPLAPSPMPPVPARASETSDTSARYRGRLKYLWHDQPSVARFRTDGKFGPCIEAAEQERIMRGEHQRGDDRRAVMDVMARAEPLEDATAALEDAIGDDGVLGVPLVLVDGTLRMEFDLLARLEATLHVARALVGAPVTAIDAQIDQTLSNPASASMPAAVQEQTRAIERIVASAGKDRSRRLDGDVERTLLVGRHYRRRMVTAGRRGIVVTLAIGGGTELDAFLPEEVAADLPLFASLDVTVIGELHTRDDRYAAHDYGLRILALATRATGARLP